MNHSGLNTGLVLASGLVATVCLAALLLSWRDRFAKAQGKTQKRIRARFSAILQFRIALQLCIPGALVIVFGVFYAIDRSRQHESDWWAGILFIPAGWLLVYLLAQKSWRRYLVLQRFAEDDEFPANEPTSGRAI